MELKNLLENASLSFTYAKELFKHNLVVFQNGEGALQTLTPLVDVIPEARLNLVIYYLKQGNVGEAYELMKDIDPSQPNEYILKAVVNAVVGQDQNTV
jgi:intraflagellar transport protein 56